MLGLADAVGDGDWLGMIGGGEIDGLVDGEDGVPLGEGDDVVGSGDALPWLLPTCAGGGKA